MISLATVKKILRENKSRLSEKYGVCEIAVFGSYSCSQQNDQSDIDILVDFNRPIGIEFIDLAEELEAVLSRKVDLVSKRGIKAEYYKQIESDLIYV